MEVSEVEFKPLEPPDSPLTPPSIKLELDSDEEYLPNKPDKKKKRKLELKTRCKKKEKKKKKRKQEHKLWTCRKCLQEFDSRKGLTEHSKQHQEEHADENGFKHDQERTVFSCTTCQAEFQTKDEVLEHISKVHEEFYSCEQCEHTCKKAYAFALHMKSHSSDENMVCPLCSYSTPRRTCLQTHINRVHYHKFYYTCATCGKGFNDSVIYKEHANEHLGIKPFVCVVCEKAFCYSRYMTIHQTRHHTVYIEGSLHKTQCSICLKVFSKVSTLLKHITSKHAAGGDERNEKRHLCDHCGKGFGTGDKLKIHYRIHTGEKPYRCRFCDKRFTKKDYLVMHERVHTGEKPYRCPYCGKCFNQACSLRIHVRGHTGERPYICTICGGGYISRGSLNLHMKTCTGARYEGVHQKPTRKTIKSKKTPLRKPPTPAFQGITFQCSDCGRKFKNLSLLTNHMKSQCAHVQKKNVQNLLRNLPGIRLVKSSQKKAPTVKDRRKKPEGKCFYACPNCPEIFAAQDYLLRHQQSACGLPKEPKKRSGNSYTFDREGNKYRCTKCDQEYDFKSLIEEHVRTEHAQFHCDVCALDFPSALDYGYHGQRHAPDRRMSCPCCPFRTPLKPELAAHLQQEHPGADASPPAIRVDLCVVCAKPFFDLKKLLHHQKNVHRANVVCEPLLGAKLQGGGGTFIPKEPLCLLCDTCGKNFNSKYRLERHQRAMHQGLKPYMCNYCGRAFTGKDTMKKHERIHTGERPYHCEFCGKSFRQPGPFSVHRRTHTGERPYKCKSCGRGFITNQLKKMHLKNCRGGQVAPDSTTATVEYCREVEVKESPLLLGGGLAEGGMEVEESEEAIGGLLNAEYYFEFKN